MKITLELLNRLNACQEGKDAFAAQKENNSVKLLTKMVRLKKLDWAQTSV